MDILEKFLYGDDEDNNDNAGLDEILSQISLNTELENPGEEEIEDAEVDTEEEFEKVKPAHKLRVAKDILKRNDNFTRKMVTRYPRLFRTANKSLKLSRLGTKRRSKRKGRVDSEKS